MNIFGLIKIYRHLKKYQGDPVMMKKQIMGLLEEPATREQIAEAIVENADFLFESGDEMIKSFI